MKTKFILTCEHAGNKIPKKYQQLFQADQDILNTHRGIDIGAKSLYEDFKNNSKPDFTIYNEQSRLLIELNRSIHHPSLFSEYSTILSASEKTNLIQTIYIPYWENTTAFIKDNNPNNLIVHISVHSFTPALHGKKRTCDIGFLYDPKRKNEQVFCKLWKSHLEDISPLKCRMNYPYLGKSDSFTTALRKQFKENYIGIELEVNQKHFNKSWKIQTQNIIGAFLKTYTIFQKEI